MEFEPSFNPENKKESKEKEKRPEEILENVTHHLESTNDSVTELQIMLEEAINYGINVDGSSIYEKIKQFDYPGDYEKMLVQIKGELANLKADLYEKYEKWGVKLTKEEVAEKKETLNFKKYDNGKARMHKEGFIDVAYNNRGIKIRRGDEVSFKRGDQKGEDYVIDFYIDKNTNEIQVMTPESTSTFRLDDIVSNLSSEYRKIQKERKEDMEKKS